MSQLQNQNTQSSFPALLEKYKDQITAALPRQFTPERMSRIALTAFRLNPKLNSCDPRSVFAAVIQSAQLGLEVGVQGRAYLVPYEKKKKINGKWQTVAVECQFIPGWRGLVDLMNRSELGTVWTYAVFKGDEFDWQLGSEPFVKHRQGIETDPAKITHAYAVGRVKGAEYPIIEVWTIEKIRKHRDSINKVGDSHYSYKHPEMYARKVVLLQVLKYMPCSTELASALSLNDAAETTGQNLNVDDAINGTWEPVPDPESNQEQGQGEKAAAMASQKAAGNEAGAGNGAGPAKPALTDEEFTKEHDGWLDLIESGKKTPANLINMLSSKYTLSDEQKARIKAMGGR